MLFIRWNFTSVLTIVGLIWVSKEAIADLPIHTTIADIRGKWRFHLSPSSEIHQECGSGTPNRNPENLQHHLNNFTVWIQHHFGQIQTSLVLTLTDERGSVQKESQGGTNPIFLQSHRRKWKKLLVTQSPAISLFESNKFYHVVGDWTMVYTEGFEVHYYTGGEATTFFAFVDYYKSTDEECKLTLPKTGDGEDATGKTHCYITNPKKTKLGWYTTHSANTTRYGCFAGEKLEDYNFSQGNMTKVDNKKQGSSIVAVPAVGKENKNDDNSLSAYGISIPSRRSGWITFPHNAPYKQNTTGNLYPCKNFQSSASTRQIFEKNSSQVLPTNFSSVENPFFSDNWERQPIVNQGDCGSCYAIASSFVLEARARLALRKLEESITFSNNDIKMFSPSSQSLLSCSFYNQGCSGGYPFLVGKWANEVGIASADCMSYVANDIKPCWAALEQRHTRQSCHDNFTLFASTYGYVGGCYECCSEKAMMEEIYHHGPIVAAIDSPKSLAFYRTGVFAEQFPHNGWCDDPNAELNGWEYTNHAVAIVGWGEELYMNNNNQSIKYWIVRNSWGPHWGTDGYMKFLRGDNLAGIEAQAVYMDPDFNRGILSKAIEKISQQKKVGLQELRYTSLVKNILPHAFV